MRVLRLCRKGRFSAIRTALNLHRLLHSQIASQNAASKELVNGKAHRKATATSNTIEVLHPLDTKIIRQHLAAKGPVRQHIKAVMRATIRDRLELVYAVPADADRHSTTMYKLWFAKNRDSDNANAEIVSRLFNDDIRRLDKCSPKASTLCCRHCVSGALAGITLWMQRTV